MNKIEKNRSDRHIGKHAVLCFVSSLIAIAVVALAGLSMRLVGFGGYDPVLSEFVKFFVILGAMIAASIYAQRLKSELEREIAADDAAPVVQPMPSIAEIRGHALAA